MFWLVPAALVGLLAIAGPLAVHLLRRQQARRIVIPSVRFVVATDQSAVRLRRISDPGLLLIRIGVVASAALALAQPLAMTDARTVRWAARTARVVIVDTSESARGGASAEAIAAEMTTASPVELIETDDLGPALRRAGVWLSTSPPVRREVTVLSDFQIGALHASDITAVPKGIGIRLVRTNAPAVRPDVPALRLLEGDGVLAGRVILDGPRTSVAFSRESKSNSGLTLFGAPADDGAIASLERIVARAGVRAPSPREPIAIHFRAGQQARENVTAARDWTFDAAQRLLKLSRGIDVPVSVSSEQGTLVVDVAGEPSSLAAAQIVEAALAARVNPLTVEEHEPERIADATLASWSRQSAPPDPAQWRLSDESDARWFWLISLVLLGAESHMRRSSDRDRREVPARAA